MPQLDVLVVEDDTTMREMFVDVLKAAGYAVEVGDANDPHFFDRHASVVLLDLHMPIVDGLECLRRMRASPRHAAVPVAIITGDYLVDEAVVRELEALGARVYFKPVWDEDLLRIVRGLLDRLVPPE